MTPNVAGPGCGTTGVFVTSTQAPTLTNTRVAHFTRSRSPSLPIGRFRAQSLLYPGDLPCSSQCTPEQPHQDQHQSALQCRALSVGQERNGKDELD